MDLSSVDNGLDTSTSNNSLATSDGEGKLQFLVIFFSWAPFPHCQPPHHHHMRHQQWDIDLIEWGELPNMAIVMVLISMWHRTYVLLGAKEARSRRACALLAAGEIDLDVSSHLHAPRCWESWIRTCVSSLRAPCHRGSWFGHAAPLRASHRQGSSIWI